MIEKAEIEQKSQELGVHVSHVQRDYVFGWLLAAIYQPDNPLGRQLILKGGNAFRKAYFEHARFSNDLDFSTQTPVDEDVLRTSVRQACEFAKERSGVEFLPNDSLVRLQTLAEEGKALFDARVYFKSFYGQEDIRLKVTLDIVEYDRICLPIQTRNLIHAYSDAVQCRVELRCLKLEELLASKLKALLQRRHSPDLYDFVYSVFFQKALGIRRLELLTTFLKKTIYEPSPHVARGLLLELPFQMIRGLWNEYLVPPKISFIAFEDAENMFRAGIGELFDLIRPQYAVAGAVGRPGLGYVSSSHRGTILEAGRLRRIVRLAYDGIERRIEPYSLAFKRRRDGVGKEYFYGWDLSGGTSGRIGIKMFAPEKIQSVRLTEESFSSPW